MTAWLAGHRQTPAATVLLQRPSGSLWRDAKLSPAPAARCSPPGQCFFMRHLLVSSSAGQAVPSSRVASGTSRTRVSTPHLQPQVRLSWVQALHSLQGPGSHDSAGRAQNGLVTPRHQARPQGRRARGAGAAYLGTRGCRAVPQCRRDTAENTGPCTSKTCPCTSCRSLC